MERDAGQFGGKRDRIAGKSWADLGEITVFSFGRESTPPCELVSLLILISYRNPFPYKRDQAGPVDDCETRAERKMRPGEGRREKQPLRFSTHIIPFTF